MAVFLPLEEEKKNLSLFFQASSVLLVSPLPVREGGRGRERGRE